MNKKDIDRFWSKVDRSGGDTACWPWLAHIEKDGYGKFWVGFSVIRSHRIAYELANGTIPSGLEIDHLCRNRSCCNPAHLEAITRKENILRGVSFSALEAKITYCPNGHPYDTENTHISIEGKRFCRICHRESNRWQRQKKKLQSGK